jgi:hypothetical protein
VNPIAIAISRELVAIGAQLDAHGRALVKIGHSCAKTEGHLEQLRESNHKIANGIAVLVDLPELVVRLADEVNRLRLGTIRGVSDLGARVYHLEVDAGIRTPQPPPLVPDDG